MITKRLRVFRRSYNTDPYEKQFLVLQYVLFGKFVISETVVDEEVVPVYAWAGNALFGSTEWRSKFKDVINAQNA